MSTLWLLVKNLAFTLLVPGFVVGWVPLHWFERHPVWPAVWRWPQYAAVVPASLALAVFLASQWFFAVRGQGTPLPFDPPKKFVRRGPYRWVRNPMYLAVFVLLGSEALFFGSGHIALYLIILVCGTHVFVQLWEEEALRRNFGAIYEDYRRDVPRWFPRKPRPSLQTVAPFRVKQ